MRDYITKTPNDCGPNADRIHKHWRDKGYRARIVRYWREDDSGHTFVVIETQNGLAAEDDDRPLFALYAKDFGNPLELAEAFEASVGRSPTIKRAIFA